MSERYPGGIISKTPPTITGPTGGEGGSASGMWNLTDVAENEKAGTWPKKTLTRSLFVVGSNLQGQLGLGDLVARSSPVQLGSDSDAYSIPQSLGANSYVVRRDGTLWFSGNSAYGNSGNNDVIARSSPVQVGALTNWARVGGGQNYTIAVKTDGTLWSWGRDEYGTLGHNTLNVHRSSPTQVGSLTNWSLPIAGNSIWAGCITTDNVLYVWGNNSFGYLGDNTVIVRSSPVQVATGVASGTSSSGGPVIVTTDNKLFAWGRNGDSRLPFGDTTNRSSPVQVGALTNWNQASGKSENSTILMATKTDGTAWYWGYDKFSSGTQGTDSVANNVNSPVQVGTDTDWEFIVAEPYGAIWKKTDGTFYGTGGGYFIGGTVYLFGSIGQNELVSSPVQLGYIGTNTSILEENVTIAGNLSMVVLKD